jgi:hypothetical protein
MNNPVTKTTTVESAVDIAVISSQHNAIPLHAVFTDASSIRLTQVSQISQNHSDFLVGWIKF